MLRGKQPTNVSVAKVVMTRNMLIFWRTSKLENQQLSAASDCLFRSYPTYQEAACSTPNPKTHHAVVAKAPFNIEDERGRT
jgi:hypothetical protein